MNSVSKLNNLGFGYKSSVSFSLMLILALMIFIPTLSQVYAEDESELIWQFIFIKSETCGPNDTLDQVYSSLTIKYFELYQLENTVYDVDCMSESEYQDFQIDEEVNLLILMYDENLGQKILQPSNLDGMYLHTGNDRTMNHMVVICHCSDYDTGYERTLPSWILSHELSHFVLSYKGFSQYDIQNKIHNIEKEYDNCIGTNFQTSLCDKYKMSIRPESSAKNFMVMAPYEPAIGNKLIKYIPDEFSDTKVIDLQRNLAKMWITNSIDNDAYAKTLKHLIDVPIDSNYDSHKPLIEITNGFVIAEVSKPRDVEWKEYLNPETSNHDNLGTLLNHIPFNLEEEVEEFSLEKMPNWFKTRALLWSEKRISDKVFFDGVEHLVRMNIIKLD